MTLNKGLCHELVSQHTCSWQRPLFVCRSVCGTMWNDSFRTSFVTFVKYLISHVPKSVPDESFMCGSLIHTYPTHILTDTYARECTHVCAGMCVVYMWHDSFMCVTHIRTYPSHIPAHPYTCECTHTCVQEYVWGTYKMLHFTCTKKCTEWVVYVWGTRTHMPHTHSCRYLRAWVHTHVCRNVCGVHVTWRIHVCDTHTHIPLICSCTHIRTWVHN